MATVMTPHVARIVVCRRPERHGHWSLYPQHLAASLRSASLIFRTGTRLQLNVFVVSLVVVAADGAVNLQVDRRQPLPASS